MKFNQESYDIFKSEDEPFVNEVGPQELEITSAPEEGKLTERFGMKSVDITVEGTKEWGMLLKFRNKQFNTKISVSEDNIRYEHNSFKYIVKISKGKLYTCDNGIIIKPKGSGVKMNFC